MSQGTREIQYGSISGVSGSSGTVFSDAATYGELKKTQSKIAELSFGMAAMAKTADGASIRLTSDTQELPSGNFKLYFVAEKNNSGHDNSRRGN